MQIQIQGLLQFAVPLFPTAEVSHTLKHRAVTRMLQLRLFVSCVGDAASPPQRDLLGIQHLLNSSEASLHQLTALLDCRGLNKVGSTGSTGEHGPVHTHVDVSSKCSFSFVVWPFVHTQTDF